jgi:hypothetical protein
MTGQSVKRDPRDADPHSYLFGTDESYSLQFQWVTEARFIATTSLTDESELKIVHAEALTAISVDFGGIGFVDGSHLWIETLPYAEDDVYKVSLASRGYLLPWLQSSLSEMDDARADMFRYPRSESAHYLDHMTETVLSLGSGDVRKWYTLFNFDLRGCFDYLKTLVGKKRVIGDHPKQVKVRQILDMIDAQEIARAYELIAELITGMHARYAKYELFGIVHGDPDCLNGTVSHIESDFQFMVVVEDDIDSYIRYPLTSEALFVPRY